MKPEVFRHVAGLAVYLVLAATAIGIVFVVFVIATGGWS